MFNRNEASMSGSTRSQVAAIVKGKCPTCGHARGGPFTPADFLAMHPELNVPAVRPELPAELIELRDTAYRLQEEMNAARVKAVGAKRMGGARRRAPGRDPGERLAEPLAEQINEMEQFWSGEAEALTEEWRAANSAYTAAARAHTQRKAFDEHWANMAAAEAATEAERTSKRTRHDRLRELIRGGR